MASIREVKERILYQGADEELSYEITTTPWGSTPVVAEDTVAAYDESVDEDVTETVFPTNAPSTNSTDVITLSPLKELKVDHRYRIEVPFTDSDSNVWELYFIVCCVM